ncbi:MAG: hypothetical protein ACTSP5_15745 [Candidatus Heimdallarchaeota archaeon]
MNAKTKGEELSSESSYKTNPVLERILSQGSWYKTLVETMADGIVASDMNRNIVFSVKTLIFSSQKRTDQKSFVKQNYDIKTKTLLNMRLPYEQNLVQRLLC